MGRTACCTGTEGTRDFFLPFLIHNSLSLRNQDINLSRPPLHTRYTPPLDPYLPSLGHQALRPRAADASMSNSHGRRASGMIR